MIVEEDNLLRAAWRLGRIVEIKEGNDGEIRVAKVKMGNGRELIRPINFLHPLECTNGEEREASPKNIDEINDSDHNPNDENKKQKYNLRPKRATKYVFYLIATIFYFLIIPITSIFAKCELKCTTEGIAVAISKDIEKTLICCDYMDCFQNKNLSQREFKFSDEILKSNYTCELNCIKTNTSEYFESPSSGIQCHPIKNSLTTELNTANNQLLTILISISIGIVALITILLIFFRKKLAKKYRYWQIGRAVRRGMQNIESERRTNMANEPNIPLYDIPSTSQGRVNFNEQRAPHIGIVKHSIHSANVVSIILAGLFVAGEGLPCVNFDKNENFVVDADQCTNFGTIVYINKNNANYCDRKIMCPNGKHLILDPINGKE